MRPLLRKIIMIVIFILIVLTSIIYERYCSEKISYEMSIEVIDE